MLAVAQLDVEPITVSHATDINKSKPHASQRSVYLVVKVTPPTRRSPPIIETIKSEHQLPKALRNY